MGNAEAENWLCKLHAMMPSSLILILDHIQLQPFALLPCLLGGTVPAFRCHGL